MDQSIAVPNGQPSPLAWRSALAALCLAAAAHAQEMHWITQFGSSKIDLPWALASDGAGGTFIAGSTYGDLGGPNHGIYDAWLARYDAKGAQIWITQFGTSGFDDAFALAPDAAGGTFIAGYTSGDLGGPNHGPPFGDAWLARYDGAGHRTWITQLGAVYDDWANALAPDGAGGTFIAGQTSKDLGGPHQGYSDAWFARYDAAGHQIWIAQIGTSGDDTAYALAPDGVGGAFVAGVTNGSLGGQTQGHDDAWLARYDVSGNQVWITQLGSAGGDRARALAPDGAGGTFIAGDTTGKLGEKKHAGYDAWLARYDASGNQTWITQFGTSDDDRARALAPDGAGGTFIAGWTGASLGGPNQGKDDAWLARYDGSGNQTWITQFGTSDGDGAYALAPDSAGGTFIAGVTAGSLGGPNQGYSDPWLARFSSGPACYADFNGDGVLDLFDFLAYVVAFNAAEPGVDCTDDQILDLFDFLCFVNAFNAGC